MGVFYWIAAAGICPAQEKFRPCVVVLYNLPEETILVQAFEAAKSVCHPELNMFKNFTFQLSLSFSYAKQTIVKLLPHSLWSLVIMVKIRFCLFSALCLQLCKPFSHLYPISRLHAKKIFKMVNNQSCCQEIWNLGLNHINFLEDMLLNLVANNLF